MPPKMSIEVIFVTPRMEIIVFFLKGRGFSVFALCPSGQLALLEARDGSLSWFGFGSSEDISVHVQHVCCRFSGHGTCPFSHVCWIMIYTPKCFYSDGFLLKSTCFDSVSQDSIMVHVHSNAANKYVWSGIAYVSFEICTRCFSIIYTAMQKGNNASLFAVHV